MRSFLGAAIAAILLTAASAARAAPETLEILLIPMDAPVSAEAWEFASSKKDKALKCSLGMAPGPGSIAMLTNAEGAAPVLNILRLGQDLTVGGAYKVAWTGEAGALELAPKSVGTGALLRLALTPELDPQGLAFKLLDKPSTMTVTDPAGGTLASLAFPAAQPRILGFYKDCLGGKTSFPVGMRLGARQRL